jgi:hypothetical protein
MKTLTKKGYMSEFVDYITDLINGVQGGSVLQYPKNHPHTTYYMDTDSTDTAKNVIATNNAGIGFSTTGWRGPFTNAWTIDGILNADFIRAGVLDGIEVHSRNENYDIELLNGEIKFKDNKGTVLGSMMGATLGESGKNTGLYSVHNDPYPFEIMIKNLDETVDRPMVIVPKTFGNHEHDSAFVHFNNSAQDLHVTGRLIVKGQEIKPGGSGGGGGGIPPELTTDQEKNAWAIWSFFKARRWTEESIAGMLGNMQSESGIMPDIDEISGGGGYGLVQWTPKSKLVDWCSERGLDYRTIDSQCQRIQWEMENNVQWFPNAERPDLPNISFKEFTQLKDIKSAAEYFIAFYEHPKDVNQPIRGTQAQY